MAAICLLLFLGFCFSGALFAFIFWLCIKLPLSLFFFIVGTLLCCTIILIPLGIMCFKIGGGMLVPGI